MTDTTTTPAASAAGPRIVTTTGDTPSEWQKKIEGEWVSNPSLFDADGNHVGFENVSRASVFENGATRYWMNTSIEAVGPLRNRFELGANFDFGVIDSDSNRVYTGPDFYGTGQPYGTFVDANYYSPGWTVDLRTWNHILPDGETQVYSSVLSDGWAVCGVFNGVYKRWFDTTTEKAQAEVAAWKQRERDLGARPHVLPTKQSGRWIGTMEVYAADQSRLGETHVTIDHEPLSLTRARQTITWDGALARRYSFERTRSAGLTTYDGPHIWGNARAFGRALFTAQHFDMEVPNCGVEKIKGREFLLDGSLSMSVVWDLWSGDARSHVVHGLLEWEPSS